MIYSNGVVTRLKIKDICGTNTVTRADGKKITWSINYDELAAVYVKPNVEHIMLMEKLETAIDTIKENQKLLALEIARIAARIS